MHIKRKALSALTALLVVIFGFSLNVNASEVSAGAPEEIRVPITLEIPYAIAGAEFEIEYTEGLTLLSFEKSEAISTASTTPVVEKDGKVYFGFFHGSNDYEPQDGVLDVGFLVFEYSGEPGQSILVTEAKYVQVVDEENTNSNLLILDKKIDVPLAPGDGLQVGEKSYTLWFVLGGALILVAVIVVVAIVLNKKKKRAGKAANEKAPKA